MKMLTATALLVMAVNIANATDWKKRCKDASGLAETIMKLHQRGIPIAKVMEKSSGKYDQLVIMAYDSPRFSTKKMQTKEVNRFRDKIYLVCAKRLIKR